MRNRCGLPGGILIGMDLHKDERLIEAAYNDKQGVTAEFNLNLLVRMQRELDAQVDVRQFEHVARYNRGQRRMEIFLRSTASQSIRIDGREFSLREGEMIHTEYSCKYTLTDVQSMAADASCSLTHAWLDERNWFGVFFFEFLAESP
jgi:uncharacterized SAM-dependent methyltransferase